jgi:hypothetical protein
MIKRGSSVLGVPIESVEMICLEGLFGVELRVAAGINPILYGARFGTSTVQARSSTSFGDFHIIATPYDAT